MLLTWISSITILLAQSGCFTAALAHKVPRSPQAGTGTVQNVAAGIDALIGTSLAAGNDSTAAKTVAGNATVAADWFGSYLVDFDTTQTSATNEQPNTKRAPLHANNGPEGQQRAANEKRHINEKRREAKSIANMARQINGTIVDPSAITTTFQNLTDNSGYTITLDTGLCMDLMIGQYADPRTGDQSVTTDMSLGTFATAYLDKTAQAFTNDQWVAWTNNNVDTIIARFLEIVDSPECPLSPIISSTNANFVIGQNDWTTNFLQTSAGLGASFGPDTGTVASIDSPVTTATPNYALAVGYVIATCNSIKSRLLLPEPLGRFEPMLLNLFAQYTANLVGSWMTCTNGLALERAMLQYVNGFASSAENFQRIAAPYGNGFTTAGGQVISVTYDRC
ncbi:MAG: hypothetical protein M1828_002999 [Chrysothrix sp. TS-e1954]|nr:MAG: hypothetical protein M1828_002999 [Chrysothrix sp. TS-e1954]